MASRVIEGNNIKRVQEGEFVFVQKKIYYFLLNGRLTSTGDYYFPFDGETFKRH
jgi:hypothetical protein